MAELLGRQYVLDFCLSECSAMNREKAYRTYMSDVVKILTEGFYAAHGGKVTLTRLYDQIYAPVKPEETRTEQEIIADVMKKLTAGGES